MIFKSSGVETFGSQVLCRNSWSATAIQLKCGVNFCWNSWAHCCQNGLRHQEHCASRCWFPNHCLEKTKCCTICDNNYFKTYLRVHHNCHAWQDQIEIEINAEFQNTSGGVLGNPFKTEPKMFYESDIQIVHCETPYWLWWQYYHLYLRRAPSGMELSA